MPPKCNDQICKFKGTSSLKMGTQAYSCLHASFGPRSLPALALRTQECDHTDWDVEEKLKNRVLAFFFNSERALKAQSRNRPGVVLYHGNPNRRQRQGYRCQLEANQGSRVKPCPRKPNK